MMIEIDDKGKEVSWCCPHCKTPLGESVPIDEEPKVIETFSLDIKVVEVVKVYCPICGFFTGSPMRQE